MSLAWLNGQLVDENSPQLLLNDTGLLHAAGVFTTMRASNGRVFALLRHLQRLRRSCDALYIPLKHTDADLAQAVDTVLHQNNLREARLRLTITRGQSLLDPVHGNVLTPNTFLTATELVPYPADFYTRGMAVVLEDQQRLNPYDIQAGHKTLSYLSRLTAMRQAAKQGAGETLWFNVHNYLQSGGVSNVFLVRGGTLITPPTPDELHDPVVAKGCPYSRSCVLPGITRQVVLEIARAAGVPVKLASININELYEAEELILTNSIMRIMPVRQFEQQQLPAPGPLTKLLMEDFARAVSEE